MIKANQTVELNKNLGAWNRAVSMIGRKKRILIRDANRGQKTFNCSIQQPFDPIPTSSCVLLFVSLLFAFQAYIANSS